MGVSIDELAELIPSEDDLDAKIIENESINHLHSEIACLSRLQRSIVVAFYFENKKQEAIAEELGIRYCKMASF